MKNLMQSSLSTVFITLLTFTIPACQQEEVPAAIPNEIQSRSTAENVGCGQLVYNATIENGGIKWLKTITIPCFYLTLDPKWPFVPSGCISCLKVIPNWRDRITNPMEVVIFRVNAQTIGIEYYATTPNRGEQYFVLRQATSLTQDMKQNFRTTKTLVAPGRYNSVYDRERNLYIAFLPLR